MQGVLRARVHHAETGMQNINQQLDTTIFENGELRKLLEQYSKMLKNYNAAIREVKTKLEILDEDFELLHEHNPIHHTESRLKSPESILNKMKRKNLPISIDSIAEHIYDVAGIRVICYYIEDIYTIANLLTCQTDISIVEQKDYIKNPKPNGYRSLHLVVKVPVFFVDSMINLPVEIQIRTIAMDFWASLEHTLRYKSEGHIPNFIAEELKECAEDIHKNDIKMEKIHNFLHSLEDMQAAR